MAILYSMQVKMTSLIEKAVAIFAPHRCLGCGIHNNILCENCQKAQVVSPQSFCVVCAKPSKAWQLCPSCTTHSGLKHVWVAGLYNGVLKTVIHDYKFARKRAAFEPLARMLGTILPAGDWHIVPVPTATNHVRQRGYDHARLLARALADDLKLPFIPLLARAHDSRQVGASRQTRRQQVQDAFYVAKPLPKNPIVLVDDVCTTAATLSAAAQVLQAAGATEVSAAVCAWQSPRV
jgi:ComF family protein